MMPCFRAMSDLTVTEQARMCGSFACLAFAHDRSSNRFAVSSVASFFSNSGGDCSNTSTSSIRQDNITFSSLSFLMDSKALSSAARLLCNKHRRTNRPNTVHPRLGAYLHMIESLLQRSHLQRHRMQPSRSRFRRTKLFLFGIV